MKNIVLDGLQLFPLSRCCLCAAASSQCTPSPPSALVVTWDQRFRVKCYTSLAGLAGHEPSQSENVIEAA